MQGAKHRRVLVVLPAITWQALNRVEGNGDGYPDVLPRRPPRAGRPAVCRRGRPPAFGISAALLRYLRGARLRYDLTTDLAIARDGQGSLGRYAGVLIAGSERFVPRTVRARSPRTSRRADASPG